MTQSNVEIRKMAGGCGAEVIGVDLAHLADADMAAVRRAFVEFGVVFFRDQNLTPEDHIGFARRWGPIDINKFFPADGRYPEIAEVRKEKEQKQNIGGGWHTDHSYDEIPAMGSILVARELPETGGDTMFASMYAAYEALSDRMKAYLDGLTAVHDGEQVYRGTYANHGVADKPAYPRAEHPVVRTHPVTGQRALYVNRGFTRHIVGIPADESEAVLRYLYDHMESPLWQCRFRWTERAVAFWDNRCVQHRAMWDYWPHTRSGNRVTVQGDRPV